MRILSSVLALVYVAVGVQTTAYGQPTNWVVDRSGGPDVDFTDLQNAVNNADPGDMILVRGPVRVDDFVLEIDKGVGIFAEDPNDPAVFFLGDVVIRNIPADERLILRGMHLLEGSMTILHNDGVVWIEDLEVDVGDLEVRDSKKVIMVRVKAAGRRGENATSGLLMEGSSTSIAAYQCTFEGGTGYSGCCHPPAPPLPNGDSGHGTVLRSGYLFASGSTFVGGDGGLQGGDGLRLTYDDDTKVQIQDSRFLRGDAPSDGPAGVSINDPVGLLESLRGVARDSSTDGPTPFGGQLQLQAHGIAGDVVFLTRNDHPDFLPIQRLSGVLTIDPTLLRFSRLAVIGASGSTNVPININGFGATEVVPFVLQPFHIASNGNRLLGAPSAAWLYDPGN